MTQFSLYGLEVEIMMGDEDMEFEDSDYDGADGSDEE